MKVSRKTMSTLYILHSFIELIAKDFVYNQNSTSVDFLLSEINVSVISKVLIQLKDEFNYKYNQEHIKSVINWFLHSKK